MRPHKTILVVGAGRFGRNYLSVLDQMTRNPAKGSRRVGTLILSRTDANAARTQARALADTPGSAFASVVGEAIANVHQLEQALNKHQPDLVCITARDRQIGDDIHVAYAQTALSCCAVLCEKPLSRAGQGRAGLKKAMALAEHPRAECFGLELPMAVVRNKMLADRHLGHLMRSAKGIAFFWEKLSEQGDLINDLALHPWSLLPADRQIRVEAVSGNSRSVDIRLSLHDDEKWPLDLPCHIHLSTGSAFRGMQLDDHLFQFHFEAGSLQVLAHPKRRRIEPRRQIDIASAKPVLIVNNPLARHIEASLKGAPLVDIHETLRSQAFLEALHAHA
ncbi:MAG: Gfo/Idh/MocA family oxidoreductase [Desulfatitalea sp.]|nr:Gfo/Idh/MocA family oxidoreductase [Desulfatitalea sp.]NNJ98868.1 Gfo/Idh/MocA family oxidoreductase [Desulfatitalea sp.]